MKKILSIDPGLINFGLFLIHTDSKSEYKNLSEREFQNHTILYWDCINFLTGKSNEKQLCQGVNKNGKTCSFEAKFKKEEKGVYYFYCKKHNVKETVEIIKKNSFFSFQNLTNKVIETFKILFEKDEFKDIDYILIEDQKKGNEKIKFISDVIFTLCCLYYKNSIVQKISGKYKLKYYTGPEIKCNLKSKYAQNKFFSIKHTEYVFSEYPYWLKYLKRFKKLDDICDSALAGLYFIKNNYKIKTNFKDKTKNMRKNNKNKK